MSLFGEFAALFMRSSHVVGLASDVGPVPTSERDSSRANSDDDIRRKRTYSIEQLREFRHDHELADQNVFQFFAEIQMYKRCVGGARHFSENEQVDIPVLQHRMNTILLQLNVNTFQTVHNEIMTLGVDSEIFVLSFVNVVFKQAVLNSPLALLFATLSANVIYVIQHTKFAEGMKALFAERCMESFAVPELSEDKKHIVLLYGVVTFAGYLLRNGIIAVDLVTDWENQLIESSVPVSIGLLIRLLWASGAEIASQNKVMSGKLAEKMEGCTDRELIEPYAELVKLVQEAVGSTVQSNMEMKRPEMRRSPSVDHSLDTQYPKLFKKSGSIPVSLAQLAGGDDGDESMTSLIGQFFWDMEFPTFLEGLGRLGYRKGDRRTALELLTEIIEQPVMRQTTVLRLISDLLRSGFYEEAQLKGAIQRVSSDNSNNSRVAKTLALLYANLMNDEITTLDEFEFLFGAMRSVWPEMIEALFIQLDQLRGVWLDDFLESDYWRNVTFLGVDSIVDKINKLREWKLVGFLPQYDIAASFLESRGTGVSQAELVMQEDGIIDRQDIAPLIFEVLCTFPDEEMQRTAERLRGWFRSCGPAIDESIVKMGQRGSELAELLNPLQAFNVTRSIKPDVFNAGYAFNGRQMSDKSDIYLFPDTVKMNPFTFMGNAVLISETIQQVDGYVVAAIANRLDEPGFPFWLVPIESADQVACLYQFKFSSGLPDFAAMGLKVCPTRSGNVIVLDNKSLQDIYARTYVIPISVSDFPEVPRILKKLAAYAHLDLIPGVSHIILRDKAARKDLTSRFHECYDKSGNEPCTLFSLYTEILEMLRLFGFATDQNCPTLMSNSYLFGGLRVAFSDFHRRCFPNIPGGSFAVTPGSLKQLRVITEFVRSALTDFGYTSANECVSIVNAVNRFRIDRGRGEGPCDTDTMHDIWVSLIKTGDNIMGRIQAYGVSMPMVPGDSQREFERFGDIEMQGLDAVGNEIALGISAAVADIAAPNSHVTAAHNRLIDTTTYGVNQLKTVSDMYKELDTRLEMISVCTKSIEDESSKVIAQSAATLSIIDNVSHLNKGVSAQIKKLHKLMAHERGFSKTLFVAISMLVVALILQYFYQTYEVRKPDM